MNEELIRGLRDSVLASGWSQGKEFEVIVKDNEILICLVGKPRYTLEELLAQCDAPAPLEPNA
jgi:antitoxin component of MazEF toxin-antitoxin module